MRAEHRLLPLAFLLLSCFGSAPPAPEKEKIQAPDGKWVEQRVVRHFSRRPMQIYHVYRDSSGNFVRHGSDITYFLNGQVKLEEQYRDGRLEGLAEFWYPNGNKEGELPYKDGKPDGRAVSWYPDGKKKSETNWSHGQLHGLSTEWDERGGKRREVLWNHNVAGKIPAPSDGRAPSGQE